MKNKELFQIFRLVQVRKENYRTSTFIFDRPLHQAKPGQFIMAWLPGVGEKPFSIADSDPFTLTVAAVGSFSEALCNLRVGERLWIRGPLGQGYRLTGKKHLLAGGGYGAAPLYFLAKQALAVGGEVHVCLGARTADELLLVEAFKSAGCEVYLTTDDGTQGRQGQVTLAVEDELKKFNPDSLYACGPEAMLLALLELDRKKNIPMQLSWEALMRCGIGLCGSCELDEQIIKKTGLPSGWLTCKDGPVSFL